MTTSEPPILWLHEDFSGPFPSPDLALSEPDGLLAAGGNLHPETLLQAYSQGIFPWFSDDQPILWWSPNPRCVLFPQHFHISKSLKRTLNKKQFAITTNTAFKDVITACAQPRPSQPGTWITDEMIDAYYELHKTKNAISVECWHDNELVGGIYGVMLGDIFFGESMFSKMKDASKTAMHYVCTQLNPVLVDGQVKSDHLLSLGAETIERQEFIKLLDKHI